MRSRGSSLAIGLIAVTCAQQFEEVAADADFGRMGKQRMEVLRFHRVQHISNMVVARNLHPFLTLDHTHVLRVAFGL